MSRNPTALSQQPLWFTPHGASWHPSGARRLHVAIVPRRPVDRDGLFAALAAELSIPGGPIATWDALASALRDLSWLGVDDVALVHRRLPELPKVTLAGYLDALVRAHDGRRPGSPRLFAVFPTRLYSDALPLMPP